MRGLAVYPGSFDPPTLGHLDMIERASRLFDELVVAVGKNLAKESFLSFDQRISALKEITKSAKNVRVDSFDGLLVEYAKKLGASAIVRGLRATSDFEYEFQMAMVNRRLDASIETVFLMTKWEHSYISSSIAREVATLGGDISQLVPTPVADIIRQAMSRK